MISPYGSDKLNPLHVADEGERNRLLKAAVVNEETAEGITLDGSAG